jgi:hypothetical protein
LKATENYCGGSWLKKHNLAVVTSKFSTEYA